MIQPYCIPGLKRKTRLPIEGRAEFIEAVICDYFKIPLERVKKRNRKRELVNTRRFLYYFLKYRTSLTLKEIGQRYGGVDHTTVIYGLETLSDLMVNYKDVKEDFNNLMEILS